MMLKKKFGFESWIRNTEYKILYATSSVDKLI